MTDKREDITNKIIALFIENNLDMADGLIILVDILSRILWTSFHGNIEEYKEWCKIIHSKLLKRIEYEVSKKAFDDILNKEII